MISRCSAGEVIKRAWLGQLSYNALQRAVISPLSRNEAALVLHNGKNKHILKSTFQKSRKSSMTYMETKDCQDSSLRIFH